MSKEVVLSIINVTKAFGERLAVNNVSFDVHEGEIFGFLGPNGAGKTTTMRMITGLCKITRGAIKVCGHSVTKSFEKAMSYVGGIIENPLMYGYMSGYDNLKYYASLHKGVTKQHILECARIVGLENRLKDKVKNYSLGMRQRLGIAQALLHNPKLLILDEPLSGLDPTGVKELRDFLKRIAHEKNIAILISSHMLAEMEQLCDTLGVINNGLMIEVKSMSQLRQGLKGTQKIKIKVDYPNFAGKVIISELRLQVEVAGNSIFVYSDESRVPEITKRLFANGVSVFGVEYVTKTLEEIFMDIIYEKTNGMLSII